MTTPVPRVRLTALAAAVSMLGVGAAGAQTVPTAAGREGELSTSAQIDAWLSEAPAPTPVSRAGAGADSPWADGLATPIPQPLFGYGGSPLERTIIDGRPHGEVGFEVGNRGYGGYGVASAPLGKNGYVQIGISDYQGTGRDRYRGGYGGGDRRTLSLTAAWSPDRDAQPPRANAAPQY